MWCRFGSIFVSSTGLCAARRCGAQNLCHWRASVCATSLQRRFGRQRWGRPVRVRFRALIHPVHQTVRWCLTANRFLARATARASSVRRWRRFRLLLPAVQTVSRATQRWSNDTKTWCAWPKPHCQRCRKHWYSKRVVFVFNCLVAIHVVWL